MLHGMKISIGTLCAGSMLIYGFEYTGGTCTCVLSNFPPLGRLTWRNGGTDRVHPEGEASTLGVVTRARGEEQQVLWSAPVARRLKRSLDVAVGVISDEVGRLMGRIRRGGRSVDGHVDAGVANGGRGKEACFGRSMC